MYEIYEKLIQSKGISNYKVAKDTGITQTTLSNWKKGHITPKTSTLDKIADYLGVTIDYLLGKEQEKTPPEKSEDEITFDDFTYAMFGESKELTDEQKNQLLAMAKFLRSQNKNDN